MKKTLVTTLLGLAGLNALPSATFAASACYNKRAAAHCEWSLKNNGREDWWNAIALSAARDANSTTSDFYFQRATEHCSWALNHNGRADWWRAIDYAALNDCR